MATVGENLKSILEKSNMTVAELSKLSGVNASTLYAIITRKSNKVGAETLLKLCLALDVNLSDLVENPDAVDSNALRVSFINMAKKESSEQILKSMEQLSALGLERLAEYSKELVATGWYKNTLK